jgi:tetratricopeptide (TPR) repeat protein
MLSGSVFGAINETTWRELIADAARAEVQQRFEVAEATYASAMTVAKKIANPASYQGITANDLALLYDRHGDFVLAEKQYLIALSFFRQSNESQMSRHTAANLASLYLELGETTKAENLLRSFISENVLTSSADMNDAILVSDLASVRVRERRLPEAERLFRSVIDFLRDRREPEVEEIRANIMSNLAEVCYLGGRFSEATANGRIAVEIFQTLPRIYAGNIVRGLANLATINMRSPDPGESEDLFLRAISVSETALGPDHPLLGEVLARYAVFLRTWKRNAEARRIALRAEKILTKSRRNNFLGQTVEVGTLAEESTHK